MAGWGGGIGAGLAAFGGSLEELMAKRKVEKLRQEDIARKQKQQDIENANATADLTLRKGQADIVDRQESDREAAAALARSRETDYKDPLSAETVADMQKNKLGGMIRTVGAGQTTLPSTRWQGDTYTKSSDPGQVEGMFRSASPDERRLEDQQRQQKEIQAENLRERDRQNEANRQQKTEQDIRDIQGRKDVAAQNADNQRFLRTLTGSVSQQNADTNRQRLTDAENLVRDKKENAAKDEVQRHQRTVDEAQGIKDLATDLKEHAGFPNLFGAINSRTPDLRGDTMDAAARLQQLKSAVSLEKLNQWRNEAKNGSSGFGRLTQYEFQAFETAVGRLQRAQSLDGAKKSIDAINATMDKVITKNGGGGDNSGIPTVGGTYNNEKVLSVTKEQ